MSLCEVERELYVGDRCLKRERGAAVHVEVGWGWLDNGRQRLDWAGLGELATTVSGGPGPVWGNSHLLQARLKSPWMNVDRFVARLSLAESILGAEREQGVEDSNNSQLRTR